MRAFKETRKLDVHKYAKWGDSPMGPAHYSPDDIYKALPSGGVTWVHGCSGESAVLAGAAKRAGASIGAMTLTGIFIPGVNRNSYIVNDQVRVRTFFLTPELKAAGGAQVDFRPITYTEILAGLDRDVLDAILVQVSPPDDDGICSFGPIADFAADIWKKIPIRIAHINPKIPRVRGYPGIPFAEISAYTEYESKLIGNPRESSDAVSDAIACHIARFVSDGATLETGLGKAPLAVCRALSTRRNLRMHTGLVGDGILDLIAAGALAPGAAVTAGVAIGSEELYAAVGGPEFNFQPVRFTHDPHVIGAIQNFVAINSALEVDLWGQVYAECGPKGFMSGPGGASDFARGAKIGSGLRIIALPSSARGVSRIVGPGAGGGPVSLSRFETDVIVTEHGAADIRGLGHEGRAQALIAIAAPEHRADLQRRWDLQPV